MSGTIGSAIDYLPESSEKAPFRSLPCGAVLAGVPRGSKPPGELRRLRGNGAQLLQGFYLGRPAQVPVAAIELRA
jgi:hypothetical protein